MVSPMKTNSSTLVASKYICEIFRNNCLNACLRSSLLIKIVLKQGYRDFLTPASLVVKLRILSFMLGPSWLLRGVKHLSLTAGHGFWDNERWVKHKRMTRDRTQPRVTRERFQHFALKDVSMQHFKGCGSLPFLQLIGKERGS